MSWFDDLPASAFRRATRAESAKLGAPYSSKHFVLASAKRITKKTWSISERTYRTKKEGATVERVIAEHKRGVRPYASAAARARGERAIERNRRDPIRAHVREKKAGGQRVTEREFKAQNEWYLALLERKSGVRWRLVNGEWRSEDVSAQHEKLPQEEFDKALAFYRANEDFYRTTEHDLFSYRGNGPSPAVSKRSFRRARRGGYRRARAA